MACGQSVVRMSLSRKPHPPPRRRPRVTTETGEGIQALESEGGGTKPQHVGKSPRRGAHQLVGCGCDLFGTLGPSTPAPARQGQQWYQNLPSGLTAALGKQPQGHTGHTAGSSVPCSVEQSASCPQVWHPARPPEDVFSGHHSQRMSPQAETHKLLQHASVSSPGRSTADRHWPQPREVSRAGATLGVRTQAS